MNRELTVIKIQDYLARYRLYVEQENRANRYNINIRAESLFIPILNLIFNCQNLINLNITHQNNPGIDLADGEKRIAIQVTSDGSSSKIIDSLNTFYEKTLFTKYDRIIFFIIQERQTTYTSRKIKEISKRIQNKNINFKFDTDADIVDLRYISTKLNDLHNESLIQLLDIFTLEVDGEFNSPLSKYPERLGPFYDIDLIGDKRHQAYEQLMNSDQDILLVGQPGIGKTFLLQKIALSSNSYFYNGNSQYNIARAIELINPRIIFVDDAHRNVDDLTTIFRIREQFNFNYRIIATSWPITNLARVKQLGLFNESQIITLKLFTRDERAELLKSIIENRGIQRQFTWEQLIIDYSNGLPGLAVRMLDICMKTGGREVLEGDSILTFLADISLETQSSIEWIKTKKLLSFISLFGNSGIQISRISELLGMSIIDIEVLIEAFSYSGVISRGWYGVKIQSKALRSILVKEAFFSVEGQSIDYINSLVNSCEITDNILEVLLDAKRIGGKVLGSFIFSLLNKCTNPSIWKNFYYSFPELIDSGRTEYPNSIEASIIPGLIFQPELTLPILFKIASEDNRPLHSSPDHVLRKLEDWVQHDPHSNLTLLKRRTILKTLVDYKKGNGDEKTIIDVIKITMSPEFNFSEIPPGSGNSVNLITGIYPPELLDQFSEIWRIAFSLLSDINPKHLSDLINSMYNWVQPTRLVQNASEELTNKMRTISRNFLVDLGTLCVSHPILINKLNEFNFYLDNKINFPSTITEEKKCVFDKLFPNKKTYTDQLINQNVDSLDSLVENLFESNNIEEIVSLIRWVKEEAFLIDSPWPDRMQEFFILVSKKTDNQMTWFKQLKTNNLLDYSLPFIREMTIARTFGWKGIIKELLKQKSTSDLALTIVFEQEKPPTLLLQNSLHKIINIDPDWIRGLCAQGRVSEYVTKRLLRLKNADIVFAAAIGEWWRKPTKEIREGLIPDWNNAISNYQGFNYLLVEVLKEKPQFILPWIKKIYFTKFDYFSSIENKFIRDILYHLTIEDKMKLLDFIIDNNKQKLFEIEIMKFIIDSSETLYNYLLDIINIPSQKFYVLSLLNTLPDAENWDKFSIAAMDNGISETDIVTAVFQLNFSDATIGSMSKHYKKYKEAFEKLLSANNDQIKNVARLGIEKADEKIKHYENEELRREIYGWE